MADALIESWRHVWRTAAPLLNTAGLLALRDALVSDSPALIQGTTTVPLPMPGMVDWPVEGACLLGYCLWRGDGEETVQDVQVAFSCLCFELDALLLRPAACCALLNWYDSTPRAEMRAALLPEVEAALAARG